MSLDLANTVKRLESYNNATFPILSVYLQLDGNVDQLKLQDRFKKLFSRKLDVAKRQIFNTEQEQIVSYIQQYAKQDNSQKGLAFFSGGNQLWEVIKTEVPVEENVVVDHKPYLDPLRQSLSNQRRFLVIVADKLRGRIFTIYLNNFEDEGIDLFDGSREDDVRKLKGHGNYGGNQYLLEQAKKHIKVVCQAIEQFVKQRSGDHIDGVILGGHKELIPQIRDCLASQLRNKVIGEFVTDTHLPIGDLTQKAQKIIDEYNSRSVE
jgi:hypothetical protein